MLTVLLKNFQGDDEETYGYGSQDVGSFPKSGYGYDDDADHDPFPGGPVTTADTKPRILLMGLKR